jgi:hypothetical protein
MNKFGEFYKRKIYKFYDLKFENYFKFFYIQKLKFSIYQ